MFEAPNTSSHCEDRCVNAPGPRLELVRCSSAEGRVGCGSLTLAFKPAARLPLGSCRVQAFQLQREGSGTGFRPLRAGEVSRLALVENRRCCQAQGACAVSRMCAEPIVTGTSGTTVEYTL